MKIVRRSGAKPASPESRYLLNVPAVQALFFQILSFLIVLLIARSLGSILGITMHILLIAFLQGLISAGFSYWRGMAAWWIAIQFFFPFVLLFGLFLQLPPSLFLFAFLVLLFLYWSTFRTQVPFYPSNLATWNAVAELLPKDRSVHLIDIGSGLGGLVLNLAKRRPDSHFLGIEIAPLPWLVSMLRARFTRSAAQFTRGDYGRLNFAEYDVVFAYLSPVAMPALWKKARTEMRQGTMLLSYEFPIPQVEPTFTVTPAANSPKIYGWQM
ncbi:MAG: class I SAM-dependent methyltransferase [Herminiimonas sp.]|uniref:class I SAM-dependent methyltransferase n=1 Tax=Herminiimonas sp. TaxID=1926289 RepID=UPI00271ADAE9|nr:class I SAM-dependent methyltransferase [Herminiimonas sp.]MDO9419632.1 class I SAM-dependent methyltransferase [Herminiimonas sp.]